MEVGSRLEQWRRNVGKRPRCSVTSHTYVAWRQRSGGNYFSRQLFSELFLLLQKNYFSLGGKNSIFFAKKQHKQQGRYTIILF